MPRLTAWKILRSGSDTPLREVDRAARDADLDPRDRGLLRALLGTEVRRRGTLRALLAHFGRGRPNPELSAHLRIGFVQLFFLDQIPDHAAVSETVRGVHDTLGQSKARYANAVLRAAIRARRPGHIGDPRCDLVRRDVHLTEPVFRDPIEHPLLWTEDALSIPAVLMKRWNKRYGSERAQALAMTFLEPPPLSVRVIGATEADPAPTEDAAAEMREQGLDPTPGSHPAILLLPLAAAEPLISSPAFHDGRLTLQGETALRAAELVEAQPDETVLDLCAAPGGKTAVLAATGARVVACDVEPNRLERLRETVERLHVASRIETLQVDPGAELELAPVDAALVDVPCSNTGVLGRRPGARWRFGPQSQASLAGLQQTLLARAASVVRPGGRLVYSTCSLEPAENARAIATFIEVHPEWTLTSEHEGLPAAEGEIGPVDGGYAARLERRSGS